MQIMQGKYFVNHSFSGFENEICVLTEVKYRVDCFDSLRLSVFFCCC